KEVSELPVRTISGGNMFGATTMGAIRNPLQSMQLLPGVTFSNDNAIVVNGLPSNSEAIRIEGQEATGNIWKAIQQLSQGASVDAIQEVKCPDQQFCRGVRPGRRYQLHHEVRHQSVPRLLSWLVGPRLVHLGQSHG